MYHLPFDPACLYGVPHLVVRESQRYKPSSLESRAAFLPATYIGEQNDERAAEAPDSQGFPQHEVVTSQESVRKLTARIGAKKPKGKKKPATENDEDFREYEVLDDLGGAGEDKWISDLKAENARLQ
jgi:hypothetical protein